MDMEKKAKELLEKAGEKIAKEDSKTTTKRLKNVLSKREEALKKVHDYQDKNGVPTADEVDKYFLNDEAGLDVDVEELHKKKSEK